MAINELEQRILEEANKVIPKIRKIIDKMDNKDRIGIIVFPFNVDGVIDKIAYDVKLRKFIYIEYPLGKSEGTIIEGFHDEVAFFDRVEYKRIKL